ncbi:MAG: Flp pilus assembly complex ATPase component TadA [Proteobacteria bacterium]|nr:Flp pilus assembly complex ATPase component TadA [Pseudomonadota bacterium]MBU4471373.1 Flp pilus assembly complex ATPase component TadA [Pseudomonadota bacterium]MCG2751624.1 Flp pilus assembly complex ATPase component TadA [Desulfobacteraceae bacterium]
MAQALVLNFMDGRKIDSVLAAPFKTKSNVVEVYLPEKPDSRQVFPFQDLCAILIKGTPDLSKYQTTEGLEEIETVPGERYRVHMVNMSGDEGFFGIPGQKDSPYKMIFFISAGVKKRLRLNSLGEIILEKGFASEDQVNEGLAEQEILRKKRIGEILTEDTAITRDAVDSAISTARKEFGHGRNIRVGDILISAGIVTKEQVEAALSSQESGRKKRIGALLIDKGYITEEQLLMALSAKFRMRFVDLKGVTPNQMALNVLTYEIIDRLKVFPIEADEKRIIVATSEPTDHNINEILRFNTNRAIELVASTSVQIAAAIEKYFQKPEDSMNLLLQDLDDGQITIEEESEDASVRETDSQVIKFVNGILLEAFKQGVSDIHLEPKPGKGPLQVRYRLDGDCRIEHQIPPNFKRAIMSRIKIMANLDIAERRRPQSGKILLQADRKKIEYRVEITPTVGGLEDAVLRILSSSKPLSLDEMGFSDRNLSEFKRIIAKPYGIVLCVGPTGSGKTTSLHSALNHLNKPDRKIWTAEDPVEITQDGLRQVQMNPKIGFSFPEALRSFLRADPDIIMIGEMRDSETAKIAIEASLTGHLVFSTLHTNSAPETVVRLIEMGMDPFNFSDAMLGVLAQRLIKRLCGKCKKAYHPEKKDLDELASAYGEKYFEEDGLSSDLENTTLMKAVGCPACDHSGFRGRTAIHELLIGTEDIKVAIKKSISLEALRALAIENGMRTLRMDGISKVFQGDTTIDQIYRVSL